MLSLIDFEHTNLAEATISGYKMHVNKFYAFSHIRGAKELVTIDSDRLHSILIEYAKHLGELVRKGKMSPNSVPILFSGIKYLLDINGRENDIRWRTIKALWPKHAKRSGYRPYTDEHLKQVLANTGSPRNVAAIHFMASTGCRVGVHDHPLKIKHLKKMSSTDNPENLDCYSVLLYADDDMTWKEKDIRDQNNEDTDGDEYAYYGFLTPEATRFLDRYFEVRRKYGEALTGESPVFRSESKRGSDAVQLNGNGFRCALGKLLKKSDIIRTKSKNRYDIQIFHGIRKRFNTILKIEVGVNSNIAEKLMAHKRGLDGVYLKPTRQECFNEFRKAIPSLTIDKSYDSAYMKCDTCHAVSPPNTRNCTGCGRSLNDNMEENGLAKVEKENQQLKKILTEYEKKLQDQNKEFRDMFDSIKASL